jgi:LPXTG-site transpeptidase (sortase) family protein
VLYGHDGIEGGVFQRLAEMKTGDRIAVELKSGASVAFAVVGPPTFVGPRSTDILNPAPTSRLTLFSCYALHVDDQRVVVVAEREHD